MTKLFAQCDARLLCGALLAISFLDKASCGIGNTVNLGFSPDLTFQATNGGIAGSFSDNVRSNTVTLPVAGAAAPTYSLFG